LDRQDTPVLVLEGARAVGKTTLARHQLERAGYSYATLADSPTLSFAKADPDGWLRRLELPAIVDEAQLLPELPLLVKERVDSLGGGTRRTHFILTGSASIGRTGMGGADPLARRASRFTMWPLTAWELNGLPGSVVDLLFDAEIVPTTLPTLDDAQLLQAMAYGGFPLYVLNRDRISRSRLRERVRADTISVLTTGALPDLAVSPGIATEALDALLRTPGGIFNASRFARLLDIDKRTMDRYLGVFGRLFLTHWLPNSAVTARNQSHARAKVHPVDTGLAVESLERAGVEVLAERELFGQLLESHVVNQLVAAQGWATRPTTASYWRQAGESPKEVDLVLDGYGGVRVGIEVKASSQLSPADLRGLQALTLQRGLTRGFVFYTGQQVRQLDDAVWALPMTALQDHSWACVKRD
jgi:predicted AAA+ superfamily ATPase